MTKRGAFRPYSFEISSRTDIHPCQIYDFITDMVTRSPSLQKGVTEPLQCLKKSLGHHEFNSVLVDLKRVSPKLADRRCV
eukprot:7508737-Pyramimonas_sp.AAC.1